MTAQQRLTPDPETRPASPLEQVVQLRAALDIVERLAGAGDGAPAGLPDDSELECAWHNASGVARRRFHAIAAEAITFSASGIRALVGREAESGAAARELAREMRRSLGSMARVLGG